MNRLTLIFLLLNASASFAETQLTLSPSLIHFDYSEFSQTNKLLDREKGWLPGIDLNLSHTINTDWSFDIDSAYYTGKVDYAGETQSGIPASTDTKTDLFRIGAQINRNLYNNTQLFIGARLHQWNRNIQDSTNVTGLEEKYRWQELSIGLNAYIYQNGNDILDIEVAYLLIKNATMHIDLSRVDYGTATLDLTNGTGGRLKISWNREHEKNIRYGIGLVVEGWNFGRSNTKPTQGGSVVAFVTEPSSETLHVQLQFNINHSF